MEFRRRDVHAGYTHRITAEYVILFPLFIKTPHSRCCGRHYSKPKSAGRTTRAERGSRRTLGATGRKSPAAGKRWRCLDSGTAGGTGNPDLHHRRPGRHRLRLPSNQHSIGGPHRKSRFRRQKHANTMRFDGSDQMSWAVQWSPADIRWNIGENTSIKQWQASLTTHYSVAIQSKLSSSILDKSMKNTLASSSNIGLS